MGEEWGAEREGGGEGGGGEGRVGEWLMNPVIQSELWHLLWHCWHRWGGEYE